MVRALRDPDGGNLDRVQIIKGWLDAKGALHEKVYDVAWGDADKRKLGADPALSPVEGGKLPPVGNTVDVANATYKNTIGDPLLTAYWKDPEFDPSQRAFYYARVIEIPTPPLDCVRRQALRVHDGPEGHDEHSGAGLDLAHLVYSSEVREGEKVKV
jgi:hypothetical protein